LGEDEVKILCKTFHLNNQEIHLVLQMLEKAFLINSTSCLWQLAVDTLSPSSADCERGFSAMNNFINDRRSLITTVKAMPPTCYLSALWYLRAINTSKHGLEKEELTQQLA